MIFAYQSYCLYSGYIAIIILFRFLASLQLQTIEPIKPKPKTDKTIYLVRVKTGSTNVHKDIET